MVQSDPDALSVRIGCRDAAARIGFHAVGNGSEGQVGAGLPDRTARESLTGQVKQIFALAEGSLGLNGRLGTDVAVVEVVVGQPGDQLVTSGRRVNAIPEQIGVGGCADRYAIEAGIGRVRQTERPRVGGEGGTDLVDIEQDDVGSRTGRGRGHQSAEQGAVE